MPKLKDLSFSFTAENGERLDFRAEVRVDSNGIFTVLPPDEIADSARGLLEKEWEGKPKDIRAVLTAAGDRRQTCFESKELDSCKKLLQTAALEQLKCEVKHELIVCYVIESKVCYAKERETSKWSDSIFQNGRGLKPGTFDWRGTLHATNNSPFYSVGIGARIFEKKTASRRSGTSVQYLIPGRTGTVLELGPEGKRLNEFVGIFFDPKRTEHKEIPYTEGAATFFANAIMNLVQVADRVEQFFSAPANILESALKDSSELVSGMKQLFGREDR